MKYLLLTLTILLVISISYGQISTSNSFSMPGINKVEFSNLMDSQYFIFVGGSTVAYLTRSIIPDILAGENPYTDIPTDVKEIGYTILLTSPYVAPGSKDLYFFAQTSPAQVSNMQAQGYFYYDTSASTIKNFTNLNYYVPQPVKQFYYFSSNPTEVMLDTLYYNGVKYFWAYGKPGLPGTGVQGSGQLNINTYSFNFPGRAYDAANRYPFYENQHELVWVKYWSTETAKSTFNVTNFLGEGNADGSRSLLYMCGLMTDETIKIVVLSYGNSATGPQFVASYPTFENAESCPYVVVDADSGQIIAALQSNNGSIHLLTMGVDGTNPVLIDITNDNTLNVVTGMKYLGVEQGVFVARTSVHQIVKFKSSCTDSCNGNGVCSYLSCQCTFPYNGNTCDSVKPLVVANFSFDNGTIIINATDASSYNISDIKVFKGDYIFEITSFDDSLITIDVPKNITRGTINISMGIQNGTFVLELKPKITKIEKIQTGDKSIKFSGEYLGGITFKFTQDGKTTTLSGCSQSFDSEDEIWNIECPINNLNGGQFSLQAAGGKYSNELSSNVEGDVSLSSKLISTTPFFVLLLLTISYLF